MTPHEEFVAQSHQLAEEFATKGTVKHFMLRHGFMPHDEAEAEAILVGILKEWEDLSLEADLT